MTLNWPPAPPRVITDHYPTLPADAPSSPALPASVHEPAPLSDPLLIAGVSEVTEMIAAELPDRADAADARSVIRSAARGWLDGQVRAGLVPASAGRHIYELVGAVYDQRYGLGPVTRYLRDPYVENVDINGCSQVWITYTTGDPAARPPPAASEEALITMIGKQAA